MTRRVGTFTLGVSLIVIGIIIPLALIYPDNAVKIIQLSPLLLVALGIEILFYAITLKQDGTQKLRYDGLSIFIVICISIVTIGASLIVPLVRNYTAIYRETAHIRDDIRTEINNQMSANGYKGTVNIYEASDDFYFLFTGDKADYTHILSINLQLYFEEAMTKDEAAKVVYNMTYNLDDRIDEIDLTIETKDGNYNYTQGGGMLKNVTEQTIKSYLHFQEINEYTYDENGRPYDSSSDVSSDEISSEASSDVSNETI